MGAGTLSPAHSSHFRLALRFSPPLPSSFGRGPWALNYSRASAFSPASVLDRVRLEPNESAWGRLWLEIPDSAAPDSVVMVTVTATGPEASPVPPTHAFLRLLVLAPTPQVRHPHFPSQDKQCKGW